MISEIEKLVALRYLKPKRKEGFLKIISMVSNHYSINIAVLKGLAVFALFFGLYFSDFFPDIGRFAIVHLLKVSRPAVSNLGK